MLKSFKYIILIILISACTPTSSTLYDHEYRPQIHFSPEQNWMNDPNGMFYDEGVYHLYYQYNPFGDKWGHMSWGHATSEDLVHWKHHPVALPEEDGIMIFSGSAVVDRNNTSGLGDEDNYPIVAIYTGHTGEIQQQSIAYSLDGGYEWTKYEGNPVLDINMKDFRDPKVFWHDETQKWIMIVALSADQKLHFYSSENLIDWEFLSEFGPEGASKGLWECPDLFELPVDGNPDNKKWVLQIDLGSNSNNPGSGGQYFIGEFDGKSFTPDTLLPSKPAYVPNGDLFDNFENGFDKWTIKGKAFGNTPAKGAYDGQNQVSGYNGEQFLNSFYQGDASTGVMTSEEFEVNSDYINLLVGGGAHHNTSVQLIIEEEVVRSASGNNSETLKWKNWNVEEFIGENAVIHIVDKNTGGWGHIVVDDIIFANEPARNAKEGARWIDQGADFYAAVTWFNDNPEAKKQWLAWANNWAYAEDIPTEGWRGSMSLARNIELKKVHGEVKLFQMPVPTYIQQREELFEMKQEKVVGELEIPSSEIIQSGLFEVKVNLNAEKTEQYGLKFQDESGGQLKLTVNKNKKQLVVERDDSDTDFDSEVFKQPQIVDYKGDLSKLEATIIFDKSIVEIYINGGEYTFVNRVFMNTQEMKANLFTDDGDLDIESLRLWGLKSAWN